MLRPSATTAFLDILAPLVERSAARLTASLEGSAHAALTPQARAAACRALAARLGAVAAPALVEAFRAGAELPAVARLYDETPDWVPRDRYAAFAAAARGTGAESCLAAWPVLRDRLAVLCADWERNIAAFARHLAEDAPRLCARHPSWGGVLPAVADLAPGLSDPHAGGRAVIQATFANGTRVAYKPRSLAVEAVFGDLLAGIGEGDGAPRQRVPWVLDRGDHGWMEWIEAAPLPGTAAARACMERCGGLLALLTLLRGGDIHPDNLVAAGEFPVIVDLECLFQPSPADLGALDPLDDPLLFSAGLLPIFTSFDGGASMVAIAAPGAGPVPPRPEPVVRHAGTDWLHWTNRLVPSFADGFRLGASEPGAREAPAWEALDVRDFAEDVAHGFRATLKALVARRSALMAAHGPLARFREVACRLLCAPTNLYGLVLDAALTGDGARSGAAFAERTARAEARPPFIAAPDPWRRVLRAEAGALARLDVPAFAFHPARRDAWSVEAGVDGGLDGKPVGTVFATPMHDRATAAFAALDDDAIEDRASLVRAVLRRPALGDGMGETATPDPRAVLRALADRVAAAAVPQGAEAVVWVRLWEQLPALVAPAGPGLCYGAAGIALFLAEAGRALADERLLRLSRMAQQPLRAAIRGGGAGRLAQRFGPGYGRGLGGMIAGLGWCAGLLDDLAMAEDARALAAAAPAALAAADGAADVMDGAAGLAWGLAVLNGMSDRDSVAAEGLRACGAALLAASRQDAPGFRRWPDRRRDGLPGLSHGAAGIATALAHIHAVTGQPLWRAAALDAVAWEDTRFDPQARNWRADGEGRASDRGAGFHGMASWCHGAPGIALARAALLAAGGDAGRVRDGLRTAVETTRATPLEAVDDLCCGEAGRLEVLSMLAARGHAAPPGGGNGEGIDAAIAVRLSGWAVGRGRLLAANAPGAPEDVALFRGLAGLGHLLVRRLAPEVARDVLLPWPSGGDQRAS